MQRKNYILKSKKNGFAMLMAIVVLLVLATMMAVSISLTTKTTKRNLNTYVKNQAELYSKNAAEYALYKISKSTTKCSPASIAPFTALACPLNSIVSFLLASNNFSVLSSENDMILSG